ncbi:MAG: hypothetical protein U1A78_31145 [Polyangia bacterium]
MLIKAHHVARASSLLPLALGALLAAACSTSTTDAPGGMDLSVTRVPPRAPLNHRAAAGTCPMDRPPGTTMGGGGASQCTSDADCKDATKGQNGRCVFSRLGTICTYDTCFDDSPCGGKVCECRAAATMASTSTNHCLAEGNCRTDGDCGPGGYCSPSFGSCGAYFGVIAYYCHTSKDDCIDDADCTTDGGLPGYCAYNPATSTWQCSTSLCAG